jgi:RHS repeat-associated protein
MFPSEIARLNRQAPPDLDEKKDHMRFLKIPPVLTLLSFICLISTGYFLRAHTHSVLPAAPDNHPPVANNDAYSRHRAGYIGYFTTNDYDPDHDPLTFSIITQPSHGTLTFDYGYVNDRPWYTPTPGFSGQDSLVYQICDPSNACATATVTITVPNQTPVAVSDSATLHNPGYLGYLTANDSDPEGDPLTFLVTTQPSHGTLSYDYGPNYPRPWYTPATGYSGPDSLVYRICDDFNACASATVTINVTNQAPVARDDRYSVTGPGYIGYFSNNDYEPDGDGLTYSIIVSPSHGTLTFDYGVPGPRPWYSPTAGYSGPDFLVYQICDTFNACSQATVNLNDDDKNAGQTSCTQRAGEPINVSNGNMYLQQLDYKVTALAGVEVVRTYNSSSMHFGLFGRGWSSAFDESVKWYSSQQLRLYLADGRAIDFTLQSGVYLPSQGDFRGQVTQNGDGSFTLTLKDGGVHQFSKPGKLLWIKDTNNNQTTLSYDTNGKLSTVTDPFGRILTLSTNANGRVTSIADTLGTVATYSYGAGNELLSVTYADNSAFQFTYDANFLLTAVTDALGNKVEAHNYDSSGRALTSEKQGGVEHYSLTYVSNTETDVTDGLGRVSKYTLDKSKSRNLVTRVDGLCGCGGNSQIQTWTYDIQLNLTSKTDALGYVTSYTYDSSGNRLTETNATGTVTYTYNTLGEMLTRTDQLNGVTTNTYDSHGNLLTAKDALNNTTTFTYDSHGQPLTITDARGKVTTFTYDTSGNLTQRTDALNHAAVFTYDVRARVTSVRNALNEMTSYEYDARGRLKKTTFPDNSFISLTYDLAGRRTKVTDARGNDTNYGYDSAYRLVAVTDALSHANSYGYDAMSNLTNVTDALSRVTNYDYDDFNRLKKITYPPATTGATRLFEAIAYDVDGNVTSRTDTASRVTSYGYDNANRLTSTTDAANETTSFQYDALSRLVLLTDAINQQYQFAYDVVGRQTSMTRAGVSMTYVYDAVGNRTQRTDYNGATTNYAYDDLNRLITISYPDTSSATYTYDALSRLASGANQNGAVSFAYDNRGRVSSTTDVWGQTVDYSYDANGNRTAMTLNGSGYATYAYDIVNRLTSLADSANLNFVYSYDAANSLTSRTAPNGVTSSYSYDGLDRLTALTHAAGPNTLIASQYTYNEANNIVSWTNASGIHGYTYDAVDRLTNATNAGSPTETYSYDAVGNRTASHLSSTYSYQPFNKLTSTSTASYGYDNNGNLTSKSDSLGAWSLSYDYENRLKQAMLPSGLIVNYKYDGLGRRIQRTTSAGANERYVYDGHDALIDLNSDWSVANTYLNDLGIDNYLRQTSLTTGVSYFLTDHLGSAAALTDGSGNIVEQDSYDSFGNSSGSTRTRYGYTGRERDSETGLYYYRARWYDPQIGRFITEDPIGFEGADFDWYVYAANDPVKFRDPEGLKIWVCSRLAHFPLFFLWANHSYLIDDRDNTSCGLSGWPNPADPYP